MKIGSRNLLMRLLGIATFAAAIISCGDAFRKTDVFYPTPTPDIVPQTFLPGVVSIDSIDFNSAFSPNGKAYYFSRRSNKQSDIFVTRYESGKWSQPESVSFNTSIYSEADPAFDSEGRMYFISNRPTTESDSIRDYDIWYTMPLRSNRWSEPVLLSVVNTDSSEFYISFSRNGNLYFASGRAGGFGEEDIYVSRRSDGEYMLPENLGPAVNTIHSEYDPGISASEGFVVFASSGRSDSFGGADLYGAVRKGDEWNEPVHLNNSVNTPSRDFCPYFSSDSKFFFYSSEANVKWVNIHSIIQQIK